MQFIIINLYSLEGTNTSNLVSRVNDGGGTTLSPHKDNINHIRRRRHRTHFLKVVDRHGDNYV